MTLVNASSGAVAASYEYAAFGEVLQVSGSYATANPIRFSTKYEDQENGLLYYGYRHYNPVVGRWINRDPIEENGGINLYGMLDNRLTGNTDLLGMIPLGGLSPECIAAVLAAVKQARVVIDIWVGYDPILDSVPWFSRRGNKWFLTTPGGHYKKLQQAQNGLRNRIKDIHDKCRDDCEPGSPSPVPGWVRDVAYRPIPAPVTPGTYWDNILINTPGSDATWGNIQTGLFYTSGAAATSATGGAAAEFFGAAALESEGGAMLILAQ